MKRWVKAWLAAGIGCCVCGAVLLGIGAASGGSKYVKEADLNRLQKEVIMRQSLRRQSLRTSIP